MPRMSATLVGPDRSLGWVLRLSSVLVAAILVAALVGTVSDNGSIHSGPVARRADAWANIPLAARDVISRELGSAEHQFLVMRSGTGLVARGSGLSASFGRRG